MVDNPLISIVVNCFNSEKFLAQTLKSVIEQTYQNWEVILWDNQSTDGTASVVKAFADDRIRYFYAPEHTTLGEARNKALENIRGEYLSFLDSDDLWESNRLSACLRCFKSDDVGLVFSNCSLLYSDGSEKVFLRVPQPEGDVLDEQLSNFTVTMGSAMVRASLLKQHGIVFDNRFSMIEDFDFFIRIMQIAKVAYCHERLFKWRVHKGSLTQQKFSLFEKEYRTFLKEFLEKRPEYEEKLCIRHFQAKVAYHEFLNSWRKSGTPRRKLLKPFLLLDRRLFVVFLLSFLGLEAFEMILKISGRQA